MRTIFRIIGNANENGNAGISGRAEIGTRVANHQRLRYIGAMDRQTMQEPLWIRLAAIA